MTVVLLTASALLIALWAVLALLAATKPPRPIRQTEAVIGLGLAFVPVLALLTHDPASPQAATPDITRVLALALAAPCVPLALLEWRRHWPIKSARGAWGVMVALLLAAGSVVVPYIQTYVALASEPLVEATAEATPEATEEVVEMEGFLTVERVQIEALFNAIRQVLADEVSLDEVAVFTLLDAGVPLADIIADEGGELSRVEAQLVPLLRAAVRASSLRGEIPVWQAALFISQMEVFVRLAVHTDLNTFRGFGGPTPTGTQPSLLILLTEAPAQIVPRTGTPSPIPSLAPDPTPMAP